MQANDTVEREEDREIVTTRLIDAPRRLVFTAWTEARHLARWFGPNGFTTETRAFEFRPSGVWDFDMIGPDGTVYRNFIRWREIVAPERLEFLQGEHAEDPNAFETTVTFVARGQATEITLRALFRTKAQRDHVVDHYGAVEGASETIARLVEYLDELSSTGV